jgi:CxxC motif-containing protein
MVSEEAEAAATSAVAFLRGEIAESEQIPVVAEDGVRYVLPRSVVPNAGTRLSLRVKNPGRMQTVRVTHGNETLVQKPNRRLSPAEMIRLRLPPVSGDPGEIRVSLRQDEQAKGSPESELICTCCPNGCALLPKKAENGEIAIEGALCKRGVEFGVAELTDPRRTLTTTVRVSGGRYPLVSVRSAEPVRKAELKSLVKRLRGVTLTAPVRRGEKVPFDDTTILVTGCAEAVNTR